MVEMQLELGLPSPKRPRGGARPGAGRKKLRNKHDVEHRKRPAHKRYHPVHCTLRVLREVGRLRKGKVLIAMRKTIIRIAKHSTFRVVHLSIQHNHLHLIVEADNKIELSRGMRALAISAAKQINSSLDREGKVFAYRYHATELTCPRQVRNGLAYVLNNWRRHDEPEARHKLIDQYSSSLTFTGWTMKLLAPSIEYEPFAVCAPRTWLLRAGWIEHHGPIDPRFTPGPLT
jgi:REP element-mobilizing transposase RayT